MMWRFFYNFMFKSYISHQQREIDIDSSDEYSESDVLQTGTWSDLSRI